MAQTAAANGKVPFEPAGFHSWQLALCGRIPWPRADDEAGAAAQAQAQTQAAFRAWQLWLQGQEDALGLYFHVEVDPEASTADRRKHWKTLPPWVLPHRVPSLEEPIQPRAFQTTLETAQLLREALLRSSHKYFLVVDLMRHCPRSSLQEVWDKWLPSLARRDQSQIHPVGAFVSQGRTWVQHDSALLLSRGAAELFVEMVDRPDFFRQSLGGAVLHQAVPLGVPDVYFLAYLTDPKHGAGWTAEELRQHVCRKPLAWLRDRQVEPDAAGGDATGEDGMAGAGALGPECQPSVQPQFFARASTTLREELNESSPATKRVAWLASEAAKSGASLVALHSRTHKSAYAGALHSGWPAVALWTWAARAETTENKLGERPSLPSGKAARHWLGKVSFRTSAERQLGSPPELTPFSVRWAAAAARVLRCHLAVLTGPEWTPVALVFTGRGRNSRERPWLLLHRAEKLDPVELRHIRDQVEVDRTKARQEWSAVVLQTHARPRTVCPCVPGRALSADFHTFVNSARNLHRDGRFTGLEIWDEVHSSEQPKRRNATWTDVDLDLEDPEEIRRQRRKRGREPRVPLPLLVAQAETPWDALFPEPLVR